MILKGGYRFNAGRKDHFYVPNFLTRFGGLTVLKMAFAGDISDITIGGNWYIGLTSEVGISREAVLSDLTGELDAQGGYARQPVVRNAAGWTVDGVNGVARCLSVIVNFTATGADFSHAFTRSFLCNVQTGTVGNLYSISGPAPQPIQVIDGQTFPMQYEIYGEVD